MIIEILKKNIDNSKRRNILLTILLSVFLLADFYSFKTIIDSNPNNDTIYLTEKINYIYVAFTILDLICSISLFKWKKWGFWGALIISILTFLLNLYVGVELIYCFVGLIGVSLLFAILQLKSGKISGWKNLE